MYRPAFLNRLGVYINMDSNFIILMFVIIITIFFIFGVWRSRRFFGNINTPFGSANFNAERHILKKKQKAVISDLEGDNIEIDEVSIVSNNSSSSEARIEQLRAKADIKIGSVSDKKNK